jgi:hypothetical protein
MKRWHEKILSANALLMGAVYLPVRHSASREYQEQAVGDTEAMLLADIRYELACRKRLFYRGLLRAL